MKNIFKRVIIVIFIINIFYQIPFCNISNAGWVSDAFSSARSFADGDGTSKPTITIDKENINSTVSSISKILGVIAIITAVLTTVVLGISFIIETAEGKAKVKEALVPLIVGMVISFGAYTIWKVAINLFVNLSV